jgi:protein phosphatase
MLVADGVGGAAAGEIASATTAYVVSALALADPLADPVEMLHAGVVLAQEQVAAGVLLDPARTGMATTLTAVATDGVTFALAHLGDSRGYVFREGRLTRVTTDHTYVQRLVDEGNLEEDHVATHPWRNVVMRSVDGTPAESGDVTWLRLRVGDRVLLGVDGAEPAGVDELGDVGVVTGDQDQLVVAEHVTPGVTEVGQREQLAVGEHRGQRGGHPLAGVVQLHAPAHLLLGRPDRVAEHPGRVVVAARHRHRGHDVRRGRGGDLACGGTADAVGDEHAGGAQEARVLVVAAHETGVTDRDTGEPEHLSTPSPLQRAATLSRFPQVRPG